MPAKQDRIVFHGKGCDYEFSIDPSLPPNTGGRKGKVLDAYVEWEYWNEMAIKADKKSQREV